MLLHLLHGALAVALSVRASRWSVSQSALLAVPLELALLWLVVASVRRAVQARRAADAAREFAIVWYALLGRRAPPGSPRTSARAGSQSTQRSCSPCAAVLGTPNLALKLHGPMELHGPFGIRKRSDTLLLQVDEPDALAATLRRD